VGGYGAGPAAEYGVLLLKGYEGVFDDGYEEYCEVPGVFMWPANPGFNG
jgi:hypothetical protein